jgi:hypothetical protein
MSKVNDRLNSSFAGVKSWLRSRGSWGLALIISSVVIVLTSGVGVTLAATGVLPLTPENLTSTASPTPTQTPKSTSAVPGSPSGSGQFPDGLGISSDYRTDLKSLRDSGWVGARVQFTGKLVYLFFQGRTSGNHNFNISSSINGEPANSGFNACGPGPNGQLCAGTMAIPLNGYVCDSPNPTYWFHVDGNELDFTESGPIPLAYLDCPAPPEPAPSAPPPEPAPSAPEPSPSDSSSPNPSETSTPSG